MRELKILLAEKRHQKNNLHKELYETHITKLFGGNNLVHHFITHLTNCFDRQLGYH